MWIAFRALLSGALRDRISLFWSIAAPVALLFGIGSFFPEPAYRANLVLGLIAFGILGFAMSGTGFEVMRQRTRGVYKLLRATPFSITAFVGALTGARGLVTLASGIVVAAAGSVGYGIAWSWAGIVLLLTVLALGTACFMILGFILGNLGDNENQVAMYNNLFLMPQALLSEMFYSLAGAPAWVKAASNLMPATHFVSALRAAAAGDVAALWVPAAALVAYTLAALVLAVATFRWDTGGRRAWRSTPCARGSAR